MRNNALHKLSKRSCFFVVSEAFKPQYKQRSVGLLYEIGTPSMGVYL